MFSFHRIKTAQANNSFQKFCIVVADGRGIEQGIFPLKERQRLHTKRASCYFIMRHLPKCYTSKEHVNNRYHPSHGSCSLFDMVRQSSLNY